MKVQTIEIDENQMMASVKSANLDVSKSFNDISGGGGKKERDDSSIMPAKQYVERRKRTILENQTGVKNDDSLKIDQASGEESDKVYNSTQQNE